MSQNNSPKPVFPSRLATQHLPAVSENMAAATASPARGKEMRTNLLSKLRPPPLVHAWDFWFEKPAAPSATLSPGTDAAAYNTTLTHLHSVTDVRAFWSVMNNVPLSTLPHKSSLHLFHAHVKPVWEDPRNARGGAWTFRVPKAHAEQFFQEVCVLAIGEQLQAAVDSERLTFRDDICGVSFRVRWNCVHVQVWNRDGAHDDGIRRICEVVEGGLTDGLMVGADARYYKKHAENEGFIQGGGRTEEEAEGLENAKQLHDEAQKSIKLMEAEMAKVKKILEEVKASDEQIHAKLDAETAKQEQG